MIRPARNLSRWAILIAALLVIIPALAGLSGCHSGYTVADGKLIQGDCNRDFIIGKAQFPQANALKRLLAERKIDRWRDLSFRSWAWNEERYITYPDARLDRSGARIELIEVYLRGEKMLEMRMPVLVLEHYGISLSAPRQRYVSCLELQNKDFTDYL